MGSTSAVLIFMNNTIDKIKEYNNFIYQRDRHLVFMGGEGGKIFSGLHSFLP